ncbi:MAG TPA: DUF2254 domain-containing protein [Terriglobia bacterium]|nr:DUF2254 domain-containing protein [Terriglobia bacterium]
MPWNQWYSLKSYIRSSLWIVPFFALLFYVVAIRLVYAVDAWFTWVPFSAWGASGTRTVLEMIVTLTLTFIVFTFGSLLVAIQVASGQLTPRIIATTLLRDNAIRFTVGLFVFSLLFAAGVLARQDTAIPQGVAGLAGLLGFGSIIAFLYLIDHAARMLRPVSIIWHVGKEGCAVIDSVYPERVEAGGPFVAASRKLPPPDHIIVHRGKSAVVLAVNLTALTALAEKTNTVIEFVPRVGDFVGTGQPLFQLYGGGSVDARRLRGAVAFGAERTIEQDSTFAFRIIVDIAIKALSKAINDPTTSVLAIDQLQHLLGVVGNRHLLGEEICDRRGQLRVIFRTPDWEDFVQLTFSEIRLYGAENFQVARRLRAMIESLEKTLPPDRCSALRVQLNLLDRMLEKLDLFPEDLALARIPDPQGLGGTSDHASETSS